MKWFSTCSRVSRGYNLGNSQSHDFPGCDVSVRRMPKPTPIVLTASGKVRLAAFRGYIVLRTRRDDLLPLLLPIISRYRYRFEHCPRYSQLRVAGQGLTHPCHRQDLPYLSLSEYVSTSTLRLYNTWTPDSSRYLTKLQAVQLQKCLVQTRAFHITFKLVKP